MVTGSRPAFQKAIQVSGPVLVNVVTDANVLSMPPKATFEQAEGFAAIPWALSLPPALK